MQKTQNRLARVFKRSFAQGPNRSSRNASVLLGGCALLLAGCTEMTPVSLMPGRLPEAEVSFQLAPSGEPGGYRLTGTANFPNKTELNLLAVRPLETEGEAGKTVYSVLDYRVVDVENSQWQGELTLWQRAADGSWQETWQLDQSQLSLRVAPSDEVVFIASYTPIDQLTTLEGVLAQQRLQLPSELLRTTPAGQRYLQAGQTVTLPLPAGSGDRALPHNGGWGTRYRLIEEPPMPYQVNFPDERQTDRPAYADEFLY